MRRFGSLYLSGVAEYAHFWNETDRFIDFVVDTRAEGKFTSDLFSARVEAGWKRYVGGLGVTPFAGLAVSHLRSDGFVEESAGILGLKRLMPQAKFVAVFWMLGEDRTRLIVVKPDLVK